MSNEIIYHYCSLSTFLEILKNKTLRLSNIRKSNDSLERRYVFNKSEDIIYEYLLKFFPNLEWNNEPSHKKVITSYLKENMDYYDETSVISHALCFSKESDKLSQWRSYANDGKGVAIGFDRTLLETFLNKEKYISLSDVNYLSDHTSILEKELRQIEHIINISYIDTALSAINLVCRELVIRFYLSKSLLYKNPAFIEENEVRIHTNIPVECFAYLTLPRVNEYINCLKNEINPLNAQYSFLAKDNTFSSYIDIDFDYTINNETLIKKEIIKHLVIGPKANINPKEIENIISFYGYNLSVTKIEKSKASYI